MAFNRSRLKSPHKKKQLSDVNDFVNVTSHFERLNPKQRGHEYS